VGLALGRISLREMGSGKNEIFVDVIDRISATFNSNGQAHTSPG
tara:strand:- start:453 stop:584 length:132 start_codon:yes stop_codon:yes gene_type:complete